MELKDFAKLFENADETKRQVMDGLIEEAFDCKNEIIELKQAIQSLNLIIGGILNVSIKEMIE